MPSAPPPTSRPSATDLVARLQPHEVADHQLAHGRLARPLVAHHRRGRRDERGEPVERELRAHLLHDADRSVRDQDAEEQRVPPVPERERQGAEHRQDRMWSTTLMWTSCPPNWVPTSTYWVRSSRTCVVASSSAAR